MPKTLLTLSRIAAVSAIRKQHQDQHIVRGTTGIISPVVLPTGPVTRASAQEPTSEPADKANSVPASVAPQAAQPTPDADVSTSPPNSKAPPCPPQPAVESREDENKHEPDDKPAPPRCQSQNLEERFRIKTVLNSTNQAGSTGPVSISIHCESPESAVDMLLKLVTQSSPYYEAYTSQWQADANQPQTIPVEQQVTYYSARHRIPALAGNRRPIYELERNETLSDVARKFYGETAVDGLIYKLNWTKIHTQFEPGLVLRIRMFEGMVLLLPTAAEAHNYLADLDTGKRRRTFEYDVV